VNEARELERVAARALGLGRDRRGDETPVHLRQHHVHRESGGTEAAGVRAPRRLACAGEDRLQHRRVGAIENAQRCVAAAGEGGGVDDNVGPLTPDRLGEDPRGVGILQARRVKRRDGEAAVRQRIGERDDRRAVSGEHHGAIEGDERMPGGIRNVPAGGNVTAGRR